MLDFPEFYSISNGWIQRDPLKLEILRVNRGLYLTGDVGHPNPWVNGKAQVRKNIGYRPSRPGDLTIPSR